MLHTPSNYEALSDLLEQGSCVEQVHAVIAPIAERHDAESIFESDQVLSEQQQGTMRTCLTLPAAPHISSSVEVEVFRTAAKDVLGVEVNLGDELSQQEMLPAQVIVWWDDTEGALETGGDPLKISALPHDKRAILSEVVAKEASLGIDLIEACSAQPVLWGSWGYTGPEEYSQQGKNRGVPTNNHGHLHIVDFNSDSSIEVTSSTTADEQINHLKPWVQLFHEHFGDSITRMMMHSANSISPRTETPHKKVEINHAQSDGAEFEIILPEPAELKDILELVSHTAGCLESFYQVISKLHDYYYKFGKSVETEIEAAALEAGFIPDEAANLTRFVLGLKPTYTQVVSWIAELENEPAQGRGNLDTLTRLRNRYEKTQGRVARIAATGNLGYTIINNTISVPDMKVSRGLWPVHSTGTYIIKEFQKHSGGIYVERLTLLPSIGSTESGPEYILGRSLRRPT